MPWIDKFYTWLNDPIVLLAGSMLLSAMFGFSLAMALISWGAK